MKNLRELVGIDSYTRKDNIIEYLVERFKPYAEEMMVLGEDDKKSLVVGLNTKLKGISPVVLSGHIDTVAPDRSKYVADPLSLVEVDGKAYGLGTIDMKSFVAVILDKIDEIKQLQVPVVIAITTDEETNLICIERVITSFRDLGIVPRFTIVGEPTNMEFNISSNGCYEYKVEVVGKSCHSSLVNEGVNSISIISRLVTFIEDLQQNIENLTSNVGVISGGDVVNRVPDFARLSFDVRSTKAEKVNEFIKRIEGEIKELETVYKGAKIKITKQLEIPPLEDKNSEVVYNLKESLGLKVSKFSGGCEAGYYQALGGDAIIFGVGDIALAHKPNEYVVKEEYYKYSALLIEVLKNLEKEFLTRGVNLL